MDHRGKPVKGAVRAADSDIGLKFRALDLDSGQVSSGFVGPLHRAVNLRAVNLIVALTVL
jgi:hypothetical protein